MSCTVLCIKTFQIAHQFSRWTRNRRYGLAANALPLQVCGDQGGRRTRGYLHRSTAQTLKFVGCRTGCASIGTILVVAT